MRTREGTKRYWASLVLTLVWWGLWAGLVFLVDPMIVADFPIAGSYGLFFLLLFLAVWFTASLLMFNTKRGLVIAVGVVGLGYLQLWRVASWWNVLLWIGALMVFAFSRMKYKKEVTKID